MAVVLDRQRCDMGRGENVVDVRDLHAGIRSDFNSHDNCCSSDGTLSQTSDARRDRVRVRVIGRTMVVNRNGTFSDFAP